MASPARSELLRPFYPALDGLRAVAILSVFSVHYIYPFYPVDFLKWGWVGVDLFFVLSGFLITGILYDTLERPNFFRNFYIRRALRIFPLFYGVWLGLLVLTPVLHIVWTRANGMMAGGFGNFLMAGARLHYHSDPGIIAFSFHGAPLHLRLQQLWSLCVEEQFYLVWPAVVWLVRSRRTLLRVCIAIIVVIPFARAVYAHYLPRMVGADSLYYMSWSRVDTLLCGAAIALWIRGEIVPMSSLRKYLVVTALAMPVLVVVGKNLLGDPHRLATRDPFVVVAGYSLIAIGFSALLVLALESGTTLSRVLQWRPLVYLGRISYGFYFYHYLPFDLIFAKKAAFASHHLMFLAPIGAFAFAAAVAALSFYFLESPFLRLKSRLAPREEVVNDSAAVNSLLGDQRWKWNRAAGAGSGPGVYGYDAAALLLKAVE